MAQGYTQEQRRIWSRLPNLAIASNATVSKSRQMKWNLKREQVALWDDFTSKVRQYTSQASVLNGNPPAPPSLPALSAAEKDWYVAANETGVSGRFIELAASPVTQVCRPLKLPKFADSTAGHKDPEGRAVGSAPDFILLENPSRTCLVAEVKCPWNTNLRDLNDFDLESIYGKFL